MPGGSAESYERLGPILEKISAQVDGQPCCHARRHRRRRAFREDGAQRHRIRRHAIDRRGLRPAAPRRRPDRRPRSPTSSPAGTPVSSSPSWSRSPPRCCGTTTPPTGRPLVDVIVDAAAQKGTGTWTVQTALNLGTPVSGIAEAVFARGLSAQPDQRQAAAAPCRARPPRGTVPDRGPLRGRRPQRPVRLQDRRLRAGLRRHRGRRRRVRLEDRQRRHGADLARRLHHPRGVPQPHHRGLRPRTPTWPACWSRRTSPPP